MTKSHPSKASGRRTGLRPEWVAGLVVVDVIASGEAPNTRKRDDLHAALGAFVSEQSQTPSRVRESWNGDGGVFVFDVSTAAACDEMVLFADRVRQLVPVFNHAHAPEDPWTGSPEVGVRIVCHAGNLRGDGTIGDLGGDTFNNLVKQARPVGQSGCVILSAAVQGRLSALLQKHAVLRGEDGQLGVLYAYDPQVGTCVLQQDDHSSQSLEKWIREASADRYKELLYFGYTNERLAEFFMDFRKLPIKMVVRNWVVEAKEERQFNRDVAGSGETTRLWSKAERIKSDAKRAFSMGHVDLRFYDAPPIFNGAILIGKDPDDSRACVGLMRYEECPASGGSRYKLEEWTALRLYGREPLHKDLLQALKSQFDQIWQLGKRFAEVCEQEEVELTDVSPVWTLDGRPYLIVYAQRRADDRPQFPVVAHEDLMALREIEGFLNQCEARSEVKPLDLPRPLRGNDWFPSQAWEEIEAWPGHVIHLCSRSVPPQLMKILIEKQGFPFRLEKTGLSDPSIACIELGTSLRSPMDDGDASDYSLIAKYRRPGGDASGYILAGLHAMGTWGGAHYLVNRKNIAPLAQLFPGVLFGAIVKTHFDRETSHLLSTELIMQRSFGGNEAVTA